MSADRVILGRITGAHGLKGEVKIATFTASPEDLAAYGLLSSRDGSRSIEIASLRAVTVGSVIAKVRGVVDRTGAEKLVGLELFVVRDRLPEPEEAEFYHIDLIGLQAFDADGARVGDVIAVHNFGAGDLIEIRKLGTSASELVPFSHENVPEIDLQERRIVVVFPDISEAETP